MPLTIDSTICEHRYGSSLNPSLFLPILGSLFGSITKVHKWLVPVDLASLATVEYTSLTRPIFHVLPIERPSGKMVAPEACNPCVASSIIISGIFKRVPSTAIFWNSLLSSACRRGPSGPKISRILNKPPPGPMPGSRLPSENFRLPSILLSISFSLPK